jgi:hypothetical protein
VPLECRRIGGPSGQAANLSRAGRSHSIVPTMSPGTAVSQAPPVIPTPPDAGRPIRAHPARRVTLATTTAVRLLRALKVVLVDCLIYQGLRCYRPRHAATRSDRDEPATTRMKRAHAI